MVRHATQHGSSGLRTTRSALQHVRGDHRRTDVLVPQEFLHRPPCALRDAEQPAITGAIREP